MTRTKTKKRKGARPYLRINKRMRAKEFAELIQLFYRASRVVVCWGSSQAARYGLSELPDGTIGFAIQYKMNDGEDVTAVAPIVKGLLFDERRDNSAILLEAVGKFIQKKIKSEMVKEMAS